MKFKYTGKFTEPPKNTYDHHILITDNGPFHFKKVGKFMGDNGRKRNDNMATAVRIDSHKVRSLGYIAYRIDSSIAELIREGVDMLLVKKGMKNDGFFKSSDFVTIKSLSKAQIANEKVKPLLEKFVIMKDVLQSICDELAYLDCTCEACKKHTPDLFRMRARSLSMLDFIYQNKDIRCGQNNKNSMYSIASRSYPGGRKSRSKRVPVPSE